MLHATTAVAWITTHATKKHTPKAGVHVAHSKEAYFLFQSLYVLCSPLSPTPLHRPTLQFL